jgi:hypothetical protein
VPKPKQAKPRTGTDVQLLPNFARCAIPSFAQPGMDGHSSNSRGMGKRRQTAQNAENIADFSHGTNIAIQEYNK